MSGAPSSLKISPSLLSADFARLADEIRRAEDAGADWLHVDVMDGHFVPNLTMGPPIVASIRRAARVPLDVHLMISEPRRYAQAFVDAGAHVLTFHVETCRDDAELVETARFLRSVGAPMVGVTLNPDTAVERLSPVLDDVDLVLVMSVFPGFGGQKFLEHTLSKTRWLREHGWRGPIEMDGGLNVETAAACATAGCDVIVSGSALFGAADMSASIQSMRAACEQARGGLSRVP